MSKIVDVDRSEPVGRYTHGTTFSKGDYIATNREYWAKTDDGQEVQLDDKKIRLVLGITRILWNVVKPLLIGKEVNDFRKEQIKGSRHQFLTPVAVSKGKILC